MTIYTKDNGRHLALLSIHTNRCSCAYGNLFCTERSCEDDGEDGDGDGDVSTCEQCRKYPVRRVCGPNGVTYPNKCFAVTCAGVSQVELIDEPCQNIVS